ncbi:MAG: FAD:protein FMN transferase [Prevotellaceae bacterium]|jgi:thiamine biosynthesis lipoprotein|nr:FAD:protein FMN transferase [Prevotellaceae bacterium]
MTLPLPHIYKPLPDSVGGGLLYVWFPVMHTRADLVFYSPKPKAALMQTAYRIRGELERLEQIGNYYNPDSELAIINRQAAIVPVSPSDELYRIIAMCLKYHEKTQGYFDITICSTHYTKDTIRDVVLCPDGRTIFFRRSGIHLNLSGFLKGYALERLRPLLQIDGIEHALINLGNSSVMGIGNHPTGSGWKVYVSHCKKSVTLHNECLTISGNDSATRRHIVNPTNGCFVTGMRQVAIVTPDGAIGEIYATALFASEGEWQGATTIVNRQLTIVN